MNQSHTYEELITKINSLSVDTLSLLFDIHFSKQTNILTRDLLNYMDGDMRKSFIISKLSSLRTGELILLLDSWGIK